MEAHLNAGRVLLNSIGNQVSEISKLVDGDPTNTIQLGRLAASLDSLFYVGSRTKGVITTTARTLQSLSMDTAEVAASMAKKAGQQAPKTASQEVANALGGQESLLMQKLITALPSMTPDTVRGLARKIRLAEGDPSVILKTIKVIRDADPEEIVQPGFWDYVNTVWVNSVLSGPLTTMQNLLGTATAVIQTPAERYFTGMIARDKKIREEATDTFVGYVASLGDAWTAGWKALKENRNALDPEYMVNEFKSPIQGYLGAVVNAPSRFLMSQDEFFKNLGYRANVRSQALREARDLGMTSDKAAEYVENAVKAAFDPDGRGVNNQALDFSRYVTFTQPLREGSFSKSLQEMMGRHPALRFAALPFVRTPANLLTWNWERTPLIGLLAKSNREALAAGGPRAAEVMAKQSTGAMIWGGASYLALSGMITGNGPGDPELRKQWLTTHQPYSVKVGGQWVAYRRADPLLAPFGIVADVVSSSGEIPWDGIDDTAVAFVAAMTRNISSKSYMYGLTEFMNAAFKGDELTINRYLQGKVASFVPSAVNQLNPDDELHELRGYVDTVMARIPGVSDKLPARRNIFGEKVLKAPFYPNRALNIFTMSPADDDPVMDKLTELGRAIPFPSKTAPGTSIDMTSRAYGTKIVDGEEQTPYDRMMAIMASPGRGTPSLREVITGIVNSPQWDQMSPGVPGVQEGGTRFDVVNKVVQEYREMARARVMAEFPELRKAVQQAQITEEVAKRGGKEGLERVLRFFDPQ
jgi:hypothetical protein